MKSLIVFLVLVAFIYVCFDTSIIERLVDANTGDILPHGAGPYVVPILLALIYCKEK